MSLNNWKPVDYIIFLLACLIVVFLLLFEIARWNSPTDIERAKIVRDILITILAIISVYVGSKIKNDNGNPS